MKARPMSQVAVCISVRGHKRYYWSARQAALSVLQHSAFDLFICHAPKRALSAADSPRVHQIPVEPFGEKAFRATPFLSKLVAFHRVVDSQDYPLFLFMDADAVLVRNLTTEMIEEALGGKGLGMAEQVRITGSNMERNALRRHFDEHTVEWFKEESTGRTVSEFHFYNSGIVLAKRKPIQRFLSWAVQEIGRRCSIDHRVGEHMIADQDYFQFWANVLHPEDCVCLPWNWNHCRHWHKDFPSPEAYILHFSFFCLRPALRQIVQMALLRRGWRGLGLQVEKFGKAL